MQKNVIKLAQFQKEWENWILMIGVEWEECLKKRNLQKNNEAQEHWIQVKFMIDLLLDRCKENEQWEKRDVLRKLDQLMDQNGKNKNEKLIQHFIDDLIRGIHWVAAKEEKIVHTQKKGKIYLHLDNDKFKREMEIHLDHGGFEWEEYNKKGPQSVVDLLVLDMDLLHEWSATSIKEMINNRLTICISKQGSFEDRLKSVQSGGKIFFKKPVNTNELFDEIESLISKENHPETYRVLVVEDSETMQKLLSKSLNEAGMRTLCTDDPVEAFHALHDFGPDLILMDMYMPKCNGKELSQMIRQCESFHSIPIVFLSSETNIKKQMAAMQMGADDFLTKPFKPEHLVDSIRTRIERHQILSSYMERDSLTGLLNHTKLKQRLDQCIQKAKRSNIPMAFVMLDLDFFKKINDSYGHASGDMVLKSISKLLLKRIRKTDAVGRYGGEEFGLVLWDAGIHEAEKIVEELRKTFESMDFHAHHDGKTEHFKCTFSAGIAGFPQYSDLTELSQAADEALYKAKQNGRNRVEIKKSQAQL